LRPRKITDERLPRLIEVAKVRLKAAVILETVPVNKQLAFELGLKPNYLHNVMHRLTKILRTGQNVPHETLRRALFNDNEFRALMDRLTVRAQQRSVRSQPAGGMHDAPSV
jgi:hypothetical protein